MALMYDPKKDPNAFFTTGPSLTEPEHRDDCDINTMIKKAANGLPIRTGPDPVYGYDDTTLDAVQHRIQKANLEMQLGELAKHDLELSQQQFEAIPKSIREKFKLKKKADPKKEASSAAPNDDKTQKNDDQAATMPNSSSKPS